jgi:hypothetical protein
MERKMYLKEVESRIQSIRTDLPHLLDMGQKMATRLLAGGEIFVPPVSKWWVSEFSARAGGLMGINWGDHSGPYEAKSPHDVAYVTLPSQWNDESKAEWKKLTTGPAKIFAIGDPNQVANADRVEAFTGLGEASPDAEGIRQFEQLVRGWIVTGEMIAACTRASAGGKMPHIWMSVWLEGALVRNASFHQHDNLREPWKLPVFHERIYIPPLPELYAANEFLKELEKIHHLLIQQDPKLTKAREWLADATKNNRHISMVAVGHAYPEILETPEVEWPVRWCKSVSHVAQAHPKDLGPGDVAIHFGYSPVNVAEVQGLLDRGIKFIYSSPYGRPATLRDHENLLWLDLPWRPGDATVDVPGYSVRILPMSSSAHTMAYFALLDQMK